MNLITLVAHLTIGSAFAAGVPALTSDHPRPDLLAIVSFFGGPKCTGDSMVISSGTWSNLDAGCSPLNATWSMQSAQLGLLGNGCRVTLYTDAGCSENAVTPVLKTCATSSGPVWKSFLITHCEEVED